MSNVNFSQLTAWTGSIDIANDLVAVWKNSNSTLYKATPNQLANLTSQWVGINDTQTLTAKTLTAPAISAPVLSGTVTGAYTLGGTPTFPAAVVTLTGSQTLTNKILTSPTINSPTIANATISADTLTGFSSANNGTFYGISVTSSVITGAGTVGSGANVTNGVQAAALATNAIKLGYAQITGVVTLSSSQTTPTLVTGLTASVTIPAGGRSVKITAYTGVMTIAGGTGTLSIWDGNVNSGTQLAAGNLNANTGMNICIAVVTPVAGAKTYNVGQSNSGSNNTAVNASAISPSFILVELI